MAAIAAVPVPSCAVCGAEPSETLHDGLAGRWRLVRCTGCGTARLNPRPADDEIPALYGEGYYTHEPPRTASPPRALRAGRNAHLNARLGYALEPASPVGRLAGRLVPPLAAMAERSVRSLPPGGRLLDVGCGNGLFVAEAGLAGWEASGIDPDAAAVAAGRHAGLDLTTESIAERAQREPAAFAAVTLSHSIEHVPDPVAVLRAAHDLLRPGGRVWLATPNLGAWGHRRFGARWLHLDPPRHLVLFDAPALATALVRAGFGDARVLRPSSPSLVTMRRSGGGLLDALRSDLGAQRDPARAEELLMLAVRP